MQISVTFKNVNASDYLKSYLQSKLERFDKMLLHPGTADVVFQSEKTRKIVDISLSGKNFAIHAKEENEKWNAAIDLVTDKVKKQIVKNKEKLQQHNNPHHPNIRTGYID